MRLRLINEREGKLGAYSQPCKAKVSGKKATFVKVMKHNLYILLHYPGDALGAPMWLIYHFFWKRWKIACGM